MAAFWPRAETSPDTPAPQRKLAKFMNSSRKIVFSRSLSDAGAWQNSELADRPLPEIVERERRGSGKDMVIFAGAKFAQTALRADIVDEYWLLTLPMLFGHGSRLFEGHGLLKKLALEEVRQMDTGAVLTRYSARGR